MARLQEPKITGTIGNVTVYRRWGVLYMRAKSSLSPDRVKTDPAFAATRRFAAMLGTASRISSKVYRLLKRKEKKNFSHQHLTGKAFRMLKKGMVVHEVLEMMKELYAMGRSFINTGLIQAAATITGSDICQDGNLSFAPIAGNTQPFMSSAGST